MHEDEEIVLSVALLKVDVEIVYCELVSIIAIKNNVMELVRHNVVHEVVVIKRPVNVSSCLQGLVVLQMDKVITMM